MANNGSEDFHSNSMRRMDRLEGVIHSMLDLIQVKAEADTKRHEQVMQEISASREEVRDLIALQREHRIDIMALFQGNDNLRKMFEDYFREHPK